MFAFKIARRWYSTQDVLNALKAGFGDTLPEVIEAKNGRLLFDLRVEKEHLNSLNQIDAGFVATLVDTGCVCALLTNEKRNLMPSVTVDMHMGYFKPAVTGDPILVDVQTLLVNEKLGFLECEIRNKATNEIIAKGCQTLAIATGG